MSQPGHIAASRWASAGHTVDFGRPLPPSQDPFCEPPTGYAATAPGTVLRSREVRLAFLGTVPQAVVAYQLLYRTADMRGTPQATLATVILPTGADPGIPRPVLSYQCAIDAVTSRAFPSYVLRQHAEVAGGAAPLEYLMMASALDNGWTVIVPDHEGSQGSWVAPREPGYCVLDGIRAAQNFEPAGVTPSAPVALWGYSGGGMATAWACELWADYAPELNVVGAALGSPVGDPGEVLRDLDGSTFAGLAAMGLAAMSREYPSLRAIIGAHVNPAGKALLSSLEDATMVGALIRCSRQTLGRYLDRPLAELLDSPTVKEVFDDLRLGDTAPAMPLLVLQSVGDQVVGVDHVDALVARYRRQGTQVSYLRDWCSEHFGLHPVSTPTVLNWIADRFADKPVDAPGNANGALLLTPRTLGGLVRMGAIVLKMAFGRPLGR